MSHHAALFTPLRLGAVTLPNRVFMAPLTRNRAEADGTPGALAAEYYRQRAGAGLIISEGAQIEPRGKGYLDTPGIHTDAHVAGWRAVTDAVHDAGGHMALQLWHVGRVSHVSLQPGGGDPIAPSAIRGEIKTYTQNGFEPTSTPRALRTDEILEIVGFYAAAARRAVEAGFDLVEIHGANGYIIDQFLRDGANQRDDAYGGTLEKRARFLLEVVQAVTDAIGADRTGLRLSPLARAPHMGDSDPETTFGYAIDKLNAYGLAFLHVLERIEWSKTTPEDEAVLKRLRAHWRGVFVANGAYTAAQAEEAVTTGHADAVAFGRPFIANPDLPARFAQDAPLNTPDQATFYGGGAEGYVDYPALESQES